MGRFVAPCLCGLTLVIVGACSGASPDTFAPVQGGASSGQMGGSSGGSGSSGSSSHGGSSSSGMGSSSGGSSGSNGGSSSGSGSSGGDDAGGVDGAGDSTTSEASTTQLACKSATQTTYCQKSEICCVTTGAFTAGATCQAGNGCTGTGTTVRCAGTADCPMNQVCCATGTTTIGVTSYTDVSCAPTCPTGTGFTARYQVCDSSASDCPTGKTCTASTGLPGYSVCR